MTQSNEFTHQLESKLQLTAYKALPLFFFALPFYRTRYLLNLNALEMVTETLHEGEYQQTLPAY